MNLDHNNLEQWRFYKQIQKMSIGVTEEPDMAEHLNMARGFKVPNSVSDEEFDKFVKDAVRIITLLLKQEEKAGIHLIPTNLIQTPAGEWIEECRMARKVVCSDGGAVHLEYSKDLEHWDRLPDDIECEVIVKGPSQ